VPRGAPVTNLISHLGRGFFALPHSLRKPRDTVGELKSAEICVSHLPSKKAKKLGKLTQEKVLLEL